MRLCSCCRLPYVGKEETPCKSSSSDETAHVLRAGPLGQPIDGFVDVLRAAGYVPGSIQSKVLVAAQLGRWLERRGLRIHDLDETRVSQFLRCRRRRYRGGHQAAQAALLQLLRHLRTIGVFAPIVGLRERGTTALIEEHYASYLREERGLAPATLINYWALVQWFLRDRFDKEPVRLAQLEASDVTRFVLRHAHATSPGRAKLLVTALRSFLRFLFVRGETAMDLTAAVPAVADWRRAKLPKYS